MGVGGTGEGGACKGLLSFPGQLYGVNSIADVSVQPQCTGKQTNKCNNIFLGYFTSTGDSGAVGSHSFLSWCSQSGRTVLNCVHVARFHLVNYHQRNKKGDNVFWTRKVRICNNKSKIISFIFLLIPCICYAEPW